MNVNDIMQNDCQRQAVQIIKENDQLCKHSSKYKYSASEIRNKFAKDELANVIDKPQTFEFFLSYGLVNLLN